jgi:asparaginyl-tRNA synthetase
VHYDDAVKMLDEGFAAGELENKFEWGGDLGAPDETYLSSKYDKPVHGPSLSGSGQSFLHEARS